MNMPADFGFYWIRVFAPRSVDLMPWEPAEWSKGGWWLLGRENAEHPTYVAEIGARIVPPEEQQP